MPDHSLGALWIKLYTFIFNFNFDTVPLWYLYMLIGLYLVMPIVSGWLEKRRKGTEAVPKHLGRESNSALR